MSTILNIVSFWSEIIIDYIILPVNFGSFRELVEYIGNAHERYLLKERNIAEDVQYILRICSQVIHGILQLAAKQFGREDILIPAAC